MSWKPGPGIWGFQQRPPTSDPGVGAHCVDQGVVFDVPEPVYRGSAALNFRGGQRVVPFPWYGAGTGGTAGLGLSPCTPC